MNVEFPRGTVCVQLTLSRKTRGITLLQRNPPYVLKVEPKILATKTVAGLLCVLDSYSDLNKGFEKLEPPLKPILISPYSTARNLGDASFTWSGTRVRAFLKSLFVVHLLCLALNNKERAELTKVEVGDGWGTLPTSLSKLCAMVAMTEINDLHGLQRAQISLPAAAEELHHILDYVSSHVDLIEQ